jgi:hypothetical protein
MSVKTLPTNFTLPGTSGPVDLTNVVNFVCHAQVREILSRYADLDDGVATAVTEFDPEDLQALIESYTLPIAMANTLNSRDPVVRSYFPTSAADTQRLICKSITASYATLNPNVLSELVSLTRTQWDSVNNVPSNAAPVPIFTNLGDLALSLSAHNGSANVSGAAIFNAGSKLTGPKTWGKGNSFPNLSFPIASAADALSLIKLIINDRYSLPRAASAQGVSPAVTACAALTGPNAITAAEITAIGTSYDATDVYNEYVALVAGLQVARPDLASPALPINLAFPSTISAAIPDSFLIPRIHPAYYAGRRSTLLWSNVTSGPNAVVGTSFDLSGIMTSFTNTAYSAPANKWFRITIPTIKSDFYAAIAYAAAAGVPYSNQADPSYLQNGLFEYFAQATDTPLFGTNGVQIIKDIDAVYNGAVSSLSLARRADLMSTTTDRIKSNTIVNLLRVVTPADTPLAVARLISTSVNSQVAMTAINYYVFTLSASAVITLNANFNQNYNGSNDNSATTNGVVNTLINDNTGLLNLAGAIRALVGLNLSTGAFYAASMITSWSLPTTADPASRLIRYGSFPVTTYLPYFVWSPLIGTTGTVNGTVVGVVAQSSLLFSDVNNGLTGTPGVNNVTPLLLAIAGPQNQESALITQLTSVVSTGTVTANDVGTASLRQGVHNLHVILQNTSRGFNNIMQISDSAKLGVSPTSLLLFGLSGSRPFGTSSSPGFPSLLTDGPTASPASNLPQQLAQYIPSFISFLATSAGQSAVSVAVAEAAARAALSTPNTALTAAMIGVTIARLITEGATLPGSPLTAEILYKSVGTTSVNASNFMVTNILPNITFANTNAAGALGGIITSLSSVLQRIGISDLQAAYGVGPAIVGGSIAQNWALAFTDSSYSAALQVAGFRIPDLLSYTRILTRYTHGTTGFAFQAQAVNITVLAFDVLHPNCLAAHGMTAEQVQLVALNSGIVLDL